MVPIPDNIKDTTPKPEIKEPAVEKKELKPDTHDKVQDRLEKVQVKVNEADKKSN